MEHLLCARQGSRHCFTLLVPSKSAHNSQRDLSKISGHVPPVLYIPPMFTLMQPRTLTSPAPSLTTVPSLTPWATNIFIRQFTELAKLLSFSVCVCMAVTRGLSFLLIFLSTAYPPTSMPVLLRGPPCTLHLNEVFLLSSSRASGFPSHCTAPGLRCTHSIPGADSKI